MPDPIRMGLAFLAAAALSAVVTLVFGRSTRREVAATGAALAVLAAAFAGLWVLGVPLHFPPHEDLDRFVFFVLPAAAIAEAIAATAGRFGWMARGAVAALAAPVLLYGSVYVTDLSGPDSRLWPPVQTWLVFAALAVVLLAEWAALELLSSRAGGRTTLLCVAGTLLGAGLVIMLSGYASGGQLGVPLAAGVAGAALGSLAWKAEPAGTGPLGVGVVALFGLLAIGRLFAGLTDLNAALLFAAPLLAWLPQRLSARPRLRLALRLLLAALPVFLALVLAQQKFAAESTQPGSSSSGSLDDYLNFGK